MKLYDLLQFSVCVFSILAAGFWLDAQLGFGIGWTMLMHLGAL